MRLKKLNIKGFKSFADETEVRFDDPIIGIVGPNGSGKSNIVDSIRWVLGEQKSKDLRLDKMTDVIFNGSKKRKQGSLAQVTLTFENTKNLIPIEFDEVAVTRILYSDSSSEYRINDVKCRLKDIRDLFLDSGIGSHSYAIIELKMVDDILLDTDRARLRMFEQAAGIAKYKARKKETINKLNSTEADLNRIDDLLFELEGTLKDLQKQAARTKKYNELKEKYRDQSISIAYHEINASEIKIAAIKSKIQSELDKYESLTASKRTIEAELEKFKRKNLDNEKDLSKTQEEFNLLIDETRKKESNKDMIAQKISFNKKTFEQNNARIAQISEELSHLTEDLDKLEKSLELSQKDYNEIIEKSQGITNQYHKIKEERDSARELMSNTQNELLSNQKEVFDLEKNIALLENEIGTSESNIHGYKSQLEQIENASKFDREDRDKLKLTITEKSAELTKLTDKLQAFDQQKLKLTEDKNILERELQDVNRSYDSKQNEANLLKEMIDNMEGFPESIKFVANYWKKKIPLLQDILDVDEVHKAAVEQYLEPYLNYFIAQNFAEAQKSIHLLRDAQKGKSQFFILDQIKAEPSKTEVIADCIPAMSIIKSNQKYKSLVEKLFSNVFIAKQGVDIGEIKVPKDCILISGNGSIIQTDISLKGGSIGIFEGKKIGRIKNLEKLRSVLSDLDSKRESLELKLRETKVKLDDLDSVTLNKTKLELENELNHLQIQLAKKNTALEGFENQIADLNSRFNQYIELKSNKEKELSNVVGSLSVLKSDLDNKKASKDNTSDLFSNINKVYDETFQVYNEHQIKIIKAQSRLETIGSEKSIKLEQGENQTKRRENYINENKNLSEELVLLEAELSQLNNDLEILYKRKTDEQRELTEQEQSFFSEKTIIIEKEDELKKIDKQLINSQIEINEIKSKLQNHNFSNQSIKERLNIEFNINFDDINKDEILDFEGANLVELRIKIDRLRARLENFGDINPLALNAYEDMLKRFDSTVEQKNDILKAKQSLLDTISEIDEKATARFHDAFIKIRDNFKEVFRSLFTDDDDCDLVLLNPDSPLESQIEIIAKPKGKKPKVLKQLSGGEKTLTATALLFSLYLLKPAPFCIFDEVDAPLDDINVSKFTKLIKKFSKESQFIIITHNKSTMTAVDVLYGIFLKEEGVSGIAPVDFRQLEYM